MKKLTNKELNIIGHELSSLWGSTFLSVEKELEDGKEVYAFNFKEYDEYFYCSLTNEEIIKKYSYCLQ